MEVPEVAKCGTCVVPSIKRRYAPCPGGGDTAVAYGVPLVERCTGYARFPRKSLGTSAALLGGLCPPTSVPTSTQGVEESFFLSFVSSPSHLFQGCDAVSNVPVCTSCYFTSPPFFGSTKV
ncbi:hypothetical protein GMOD_00000032 [Pyrenophora seminiperda CCB06]|uniref:Uncharacterized protein n=1 Tax=Pyrenophora seminiperda CCB06 TaxID=1302712 RepID=A0A3M7M675_9PLEO|nr:hypothetical protein GMOD_00000032 [Pyrenophora seminiperda CCB06]